MELTLQKLYKNTNGKRYLGKSGDLIDIPKKAEIKIGSKDMAKVLYFSKDLNWSEPLL